ncbi:MAG: hypothetical protein ACKOF3_13665 [Spartobacteria bacterium]
MIRGILLILLVCTASAFAGNAGSAILALRTVADQPYAADARIVEVKGERADPMPAEWQILLADPSARGGVREVSVANGAITSERTPLKGFQNVAEMPAIQPSEVSVDSSSLFQSVQEHASEARVSFHWVDYTLRTDASTREPVWTVCLYDEMGAIVGTMGIAAQGGAIVQAIQMPDGSPVKKSQGKKVGGLIGKIGDFTESTARKIGDTTLRTVGTVQEFLVGERTIGPKDDE